MRSTYTVCVCLQSSLVLRTLEGPYDANPFGLEARTSAFVMWGGTVGKEVVVSSRFGICLIVLLLSNQILHACFGFIARAYKPLGF